MGTEDNMNTNLISTRVAEMEMSSGSMFKSSNESDPFFGSGWDPLVSLGQGENFRGSPMVPHNEFGNPAYTVALESQTISNFPHPGHYQSGSGMGPKVPYFGNVSPLGLSEYGQISRAPNYPSTNEGGMSEEEEASSSGKKKRRAPESHSPFNPNKNAEGEQQREPSEDSSGQDEKKQKIKQMGKQAKDNSDSGEAPKENYIHMRAKRGQATNSHSLAERVRREKISERMKLLQEIVPGCNKITGKAVMLDEIINYVQSLQQQVEFLSMKLATVNPEINIDIEQILSKDILHSRGSNAAILGFGPGLSSSHPYQQGITTPPFHHLPQTIWDSELQSLLQMGFDSNTAINNMGPNARSKLEL